MEKFTKITSKAVPLAIENIDTDQIIPARFLKATDKKGLVIMYSEIGDLIKMEIPTQLFH